MKSVTLRLSSRQRPYIVRVKMPRSPPSEEFEDGEVMTLTERVSNSPSGEYRDDITTCLLRGESAVVGEVRHWDLART